MTAIDTRKHWSRLAPWPRGVDPAGLRAHFAAMAHAHLLAFDEATLRPGGGTGVAHTFQRHLRPAIAAFTAAAAVPVSDDELVLTVASVMDAVNGGEMREFLFEWLTIAGIDPDRISPDTDDFNAGTAPDANPEPADREIGGAA